MLTAYQGTVHEEPPLSTHLLQQVQPVGDVQKHVPALEHPPSLADQVLKGLRRARGDAQNEVVVGSYDFLGGGTLPLRRPKARVLGGRFSWGNAFPLARHLHHPFMS